jgi:hypothetical protein
VSRWRRSGTFASRCVLGAVAAAAVITVAPAAAEQPWGFEQVTPVVKGEGTVGTVRGFRTSPDGNTFLHEAKLPFSSVPAEASPLLVRYAATRGADGWHNLPLDPPMDIVDSYYYGVLNSSSDVSHVVVGSNRALTPGATPHGGNLYVRDTRTGAYTLMATSSDPTLSTIGGTANTQGPVGHAFVANDGRSALFQAGAVMNPGDPPGVVYRWTASGGLEAMSVLPADEGGDLVGGATIGSELAGARDAMPVDDGHALDRVYFTGIRPGFGSGGVYVRENGQTRAISRSRIPGAPSTTVDALPDAAGEGGRYLTFHTIAATPLTQDTPNNTDYRATFIYRYDAVDGSLTYVGTGSGYASPVLQMTPDGKTVAFISAAKLTPAATDGFDTNQMNLYVWHDDGTPAGTTQLVMTTDPGSTASSTFSFLRRLTPNGRYLAFTDNSTSVAARFGKNNVSSGCPAPYTVDPPGPCDEVYVYDVTTATLACASCVPGASTAIGHSGEPFNVDPASHGQIEVEHYQARTVTDDGTVFFTTPDDLLPQQDSNRKNDVYAYRDGQLRLVSRGTPDRSSRFLDATPDGKTIFFATDDPIAPTDVDEETDVYMTREGAGFAYTPPAVAPSCAGGDCRDLEAPAQSQPIAAMVTFNGAGDLPAPLTKVSVVKAKSVRGSVATLSVKVPAKGRLRAAGGGLVTVTRSASKAGSYRIRVALTATAKKALQRGRSVSRKVTVTFTPSDGRASSATVSLTFKPAKTIKKGQQS